MDPVTINGVIIGDVPQNPPVGAETGADHFNLFATDQACYQAVREADQGRITYAYSDIKKANSYKFQIVDDGERQAAQNKVDAASQYVSDKEPAAEANLTATAASDNAVNQQAAEINADPTVKQDAQNDAADVQAANDAKALGLDPNAAYNNSVIDRTLHLPDGTSAGAGLGELGSSGGISGIANLPKTALGKLPGAVSGAGASIVANTLGPWKWVLIGAGVLVAFGAAFYGMVYFRAAKTVAGAAA